MTTLLKMTNSELLNYYVNICIISYNHIMLGCILGNFITVLLKMAHIQNPGHRRAIFK